jgi:ketosteroid isomerase-like protein
MEEINQMNVGQVNHLQLIESFYQAFQRKDWKGMQDCYHPEIQFSDPVFPNLKGEEAKAMWHMLALAGKDLSLEFRNARADGNNGSCDWDARYSFSRTGRKVHNVIHANFEFKNGKIIRHQDTFDFWRWTRMALGTTGTLLGWSPVIQNKIRATASGNLQKFIRENPQYKS